MRPTNTYRVSNKAWGIDWFRIALTVALGVAACVAAYAWLA